MEPFLDKFSPEVLDRMKSAKRDAYCKYDKPPAHGVHVVDAHRAMLDRET
jgi:hypothetical protein